MSTRSEEIKKRLEARNQPETTELQIINEWRRDRFKEEYEEIGYRPQKKTIEALVASSAHPYDVRKLAKMGCPPRLISRILA